MFHDPMDCSTPGFLVPHHLLEFAQVHVHCISDTIQPSHPLSPSSSSIFPSFRVFSNELAICIRWPKDWSFSFSISSSNEYSGLISFRIDWFDLLSVQGTLKSVLQHYSSKTSILQCCSPWGHKELDTTEWLNNNNSLLYGRTLTSIHDYWKNHSFDYMDLCQQSNISAF